MIWWTEFVHNYDVEKVKKFKRSNVSGFWIKLNPPPPPQIVIGVNFDIPPMHGTRKD